MGKMACRVRLAKGDAIDVQASLAFGVRPATLTLAKADLVLKQ
jgi:translation initiation factor IF-1